MIRLDVDYARNKSLWLDCWIIFKTVPALIVQVQDTRARRRDLRRASSPVPVPAPALAPQPIAQAAPVSSSFHRVLHTDVRR
jgi:hypothetical protein